MSLKTSQTEWILIIIAFFAEFELRQLADVHFFLGAQDRTNTFTIWQHLFSKIFKNHCTPNVLTNEI